MRERLANLGLATRMAMALTAVLAVALAITSVAIYRGTGAQLQDQIDRELRVDAEAFTRRGLAAGESQPTSLADAARRYVQAQPFRPSTRVLIATIPGAGVVTNEPELVRLAHEPGESQATQAHENQEALKLRRAQPGYTTVELKDVGPLRLLTRTIRRSGRPAARLSVGEALQPARRAQESVAHTYWIAGSLTLIAALLAAGLLAARLSRPLRRMADVAARVDAGELSPRMPATTGGAEMRTLAHSFNHMLDRLDAAFAGQRAFVAEASHELRTPLTVISGQLEVLARSETPSPEDVRRVEGYVRTEVRRMQRIVDELLLLARSEQPEFLRCTSLDLRPFLEELAASIQATHARHVEVHAADGQLRADPDRLAQALRNLLANAVEHTQAEGRIRLAAEATADGVSVCVDDDGPGIPSDQRERVFDRFHRLDPSHTRKHGGAGLGLPIAKAIIDAHGGGIAAELAPIGGTRIRLTLPDFSPAQLSAKSEVVQASS